MKKTKIFIATMNSGKQEIEAELFTVDGFEETFAVHNEYLDLSIDPLFAVSEVSTGMIVSGGFKDKKTAKKLSKIKLLNNIEKWQDIKAKAIKRLKSNYYIEYPLNILTTKPSV